MTAKDTTTTIGTPYVVIVANGALQYFDMTLVKATDKGFGSA